jgi:hypothetical protein
MRGAEILPTLVFVKQAGKALPLCFTYVLEALVYSEMSVQNTAIFIVIAVRTSNLATLRNDCNTDRRYARFFPHCTI